MFKNRYELHCHGRGRIVVDDDVYKVILETTSIFFSVHMEVCKLQKRQTYQNNLHSELWNMESLPKSSSLKKIEKNRERTAGIQASKKKSMPSMAAYNVYDYSVD